MGARPQNTPPDLLDFVKRQAPGLQYLLSVCTGAWILATAGLLEGKNATTNKAAFAQIRVSLCVAADGSPVRRLTTRSILGCNQSQHPLDPESEMGCGRDNLDELWRVSGDGHGVRVDDAPGGTGVRNEGSKYCRVACREPGRRPIRGDLRTCGELRRCDGASACYLVSRRVR